VRLQAKEKSAAMVKLLYHSVYALENTHRNDFRGRALSVGYHIRRYSEAKFNRWPNSAAILGGRNMVHH
jgi:hypothetical protein